MPMCHADGEPTFPYSVEVLIQDSNGIGLDHYHILAKVATQAYAWDMADFTAMKYPVVVVREIETQVVVYRKSWGMHG